MPGVRVQAAPVFSQAAAEMSVNTKEIYVVVQFYPWFKVYIPLVLYSSHIPIHKNKGKYNLKHSVYTPRPVTHTTLK